MHEPISRRTFFGLLFAAFLALFLWWFRRFDLAPVVQNFFGLPQDVLQRVNSRFNSLRKRNPILYQQSVVFFGFYQFRMANLLPGNLRKKVVTEWVNFLFYHRDLSWPYIGYPSVGEFEICNGLIRNS